MFENIRKELCEMAVEYSPMKGRFSLNSRGYEQMGPVIQWSAVHPARLRYVRTGSAARKQEVRTHFALETLRSPVVA